MTRASIVLLPQFGQGGRSAVGRLDIPDTRLSDVSSIAHTSTALIYTFVLYGRENEETSAKLKMEMEHRRGLSEPTPSDYLARQSSNG